MEAVNQESTPVNNTNEIEDCAVCLQKCQHPTQLPCGHIFCFLCVKGVAIQNRKCAMCRNEIPADYLEHPILLEKTELPNSDDTDSGEGFQWYYEGRNGWWKYDKRSNADLETSYNASETDCVLLLAGASYIVNFEAMIQVRRNDPTRKRRVKRDTPLFPAKGVAGIKVIRPNEIEVKNEGDNNEIDQNETEVITIPEEDINNVISDQNLIDDPVPNETDSIVSQLRSMNIDTNSENTEDFEST